MHRLAITLALALAGVVSALEVRAQAPVALSIEEAVERALEHNRRLEAARADARAAEAAYHEVRARRLPSVQARAGYTRLSTAPAAEIEIPGFDTTFTLFPVPLDQVHSEVGVEAPLFTGFRLVNQTRAAAHQAEAMALLAEQEAADVAFAVRATYWRLQQAAALRAALEAGLRAVDEHVRRVAVLIGEGAALQVDLLAARTRRSEVLLEMLDADNALELARLELNRMIGLPLDAQVEASTPAAPSPDVDLDLYVAAAVEARPQLTALAAGVRAAAAELAAARGAWLPEVAAFGRFVYARPNPIFFLEQDEFRGHFEGGLVVRWSLFQGGARPAARRGAEARLEAAQARLAEAQEVVRVEVRRRYLELRRALEAADVAGQHLEEAQETFRVVERQFAEGAVLAGQVLEAERALRAARARQAQAAGEVAIAEAALLNVVGRVR